MGNDRKAIFFDRDGVINSNRDHYYIRRAEELEINPGVGETLRELKEQGYLLIIISNQGGVSKGLHTREDVEKLHLHLRKELEKQGATIDDIYYCPHHPDEEACLCRKPLPLMIEKAMARYRIDPADSWFIGDSERDVEAGQAAGIKTLLIKSNGDLRTILDNIRKG
jgi:D-glycero-D-manno-heptose 1,7-bisphosphate phosphatase